MNVNKNIGSGRKITVCGSMKFWDEIVEIGSYLTRMGNVVIIPIKDMRPNEEIDDYARKMYAREHKKKIDISDCIYVVNIGGYIGESVKREIAYAHETDKPVFFHESALQNPHIVTLIGSRRFKDIFDFAAMKHTMKGEIVFTPSIFMWNDPTELSSAEHAILDTLHQRKMMMSDEIIVVNGGGYIGEDTMKEIEFAKENNLNIKMMYPEWNGEVLKK